MPFIKENKGDLKNERSCFLPTHEWFNKRIILSESLTLRKKSLAIVFVELPEVGDILEKGQSFANVESVKAVSEIYAP